MKRKKDWVDSEAQGGGSAHGHPEVMRACCCSCAPVHHTQGTENVSEVLGESNELQGKVYPPCGVLGRLLFYVLCL